MSGYAPAPYGTLPKGRAGRRGKEVSISACLFMMNVLEEIIFYIYFTMHILADIMAETFLGEFVLGRVYAISRLIGNKKTFRVERPLQAEWPFSIYDEKRNTYTKSKLPSSEGRKGSVSPAAEGAAILVVRHGIATAVKWVGSGPGGNKALISTLKLEACLGDVQLPPCNHQDLVCKGQSSIILQS